MNSTASAVMTCAVAVGATIDLILPIIPSGAQRGWPGDHGVMNRDPEAMLFRRTDDLLPGAVDEC
jgi:hypothetical protein